MADFHPKGELARAFGLYLDDGGVTDRATVIIDAGGAVRHLSSVGTGGKRDMLALLAEARRIDAAYTGDTAAVTPSGVPADTVLYVKSHCGFSTSVLRAVKNLHLEQLEVVNISEDETARRALQTQTTKSTAPCLVTGGEALFESEEIILRLARQSTGL